MTAPERIWAWHFTPSKVLPEIKGGWTDEPDRRETEYILHDAAALAASPVVQDMIRQAVEAEREAIAERVEDVAAAFLTISHDYGEGKLAVKFAEIVASNLTAAIRARKGE